MIEPGKFEIAETRSEDMTTVSVTGELDLRTTEMLKARLGEALGAGVSELTLDLTRLTFMDSTGLRLLIELNYQARSERWRLRLLAPTNRAAAQVLRITAIDTALPFETGGS